jgi:hypothetical protein
LTDEAEMKDTQLKDADLKWKETDQRGSYRAKNQQWRGDLTGTLEPFRKDNSISKGDIL